MAQQQLKELKYNGKKVVVEVARRDANGNVINTTYATKTELTTHTNDTSNPHSVTKAQVGLGNVVNTGDSDIPVSGGATKFTTGGAYTELAKKQDNLTAGEGIDITNNTISVSLADDGGLEISQDKLRVDDTIATVTQVNGKVDKIATGNLAAYTHNGATQGSVDIISDSATASTLVRRTSEGKIVAGAPTANTHATTKQYVDDADTALGVRIDNLEARGRYLSGWNCSTGRPTSYPPVPSGQTSYTYTYKTGDYYVVTAVGSTKKKPSGTLISTADGGGSWTVLSENETLAIAVGDYYLYDGNGIWSLIHVDTNTHRPIKFKGNDFLGNDINPLNFAEGDNVSLTSSTDSVTGTKTITIAATDTTYSNGNGINIDTDNEISVKTDGNILTFDGQGVLGVDTSKIVVANPTGITSTSLTKLKVGSSLYNIPDTTYTNGDGIDIAANNEISVKTTGSILTFDSQGNMDVDASKIVQANPTDAGSGTLTKLKVGNQTYNIEGKTYTAGTNITISAQNVISATDTTYTAGDGIDITSNTISVNLAEDGGLEISQDKLRVDDTIATVTQLNGKESTDNKVTTITSSSTNTQYPSALAVYNYAQPVLTSANEGNGITITTDTGTGAKIINSVITATDVTIDY